MTKFVRSNFVSNMIENWTWKLKATSSINQASFIFWSRQHQLSKPSSSIAHFIQAVNMTTHRFFSFYICYEGHLTLWSFILILAHWNSVSRFQVSVNSRCAVAQLVQPPSKRFRVTVQLYWPEFKSWPRHKVVGKNPSCAICCRYTSTVWEEVGKKVSVKRSEGCSG